MPTWAHAPNRDLLSAGAYIVTAATYQKTCLFHDANRLTMLEQTVLETFDEFGWRLQAWAVFQNHYHVVGFSSADPSDLGKLIARIHACTARELNRLDNSPGRKVWHQIWDTRLSSEISYFSRLAYVHRNPVKHGLVRAPEMYEWCSADWFVKSADAPFFNTVMSFKTDRVSVYDDF